MYIYLSNEETTPVEVYFDDFKVAQVKSLVIQADDYYPFCLSFNSYKRENVISNFFQYNGKELQPELSLGWSDYGARMYNSDIGRWMAIDPLSDQMRRHSPYNYAYDNPIWYVGPDGMKAEGCNGDPKCLEALKQKNSALMKRMTAEGNARTLGKDEVKEFKKTLAKAQHAIKTAEEKQARADAEVRDKIQGYSEMFGHTGKIYQVLPTNTQGQLFQANKLFGRIGTAFDVVHLYDQADKGEFGKVVLTAVGMTSYGVLIDAGQAMWQIGMSQMPENVAYWRNRSREPYAKSVMYEKSGHYDEAKKWENIARDLSEYAKGQTKFLAPK